MCETVTETPLFLKMLRARARTPIPSRACVLVLAMLSLWSDASSADTATPRDLRWKLTMGEYAYAGYIGSDINLRWRGDGTDGWLGIYSDRIFGTQARVGTDTVIQVTNYVQVQPSLQLATRGFVGGSVNLQVGGAWYGIAGVGRTDARPYFNLNFDPNDAVTLGGGYQNPSGASFMVFVVADDRFHTGQRDWHLNARIPNDESHVTLDVLRKSGQGDAGYVNAWGFSANYDWPRWFLRLAYDPYQNFSTQNAWRLAAGIRF
jgi:hypothetical protein